MSQEMICQECPNGCRLSAVVGDDTVQVSGQQCDKGIVFARRQMNIHPTASLSQPQVFVGPSRSIYPFAGLTEIARSWGLALQKNRPEIDIQGSPERTEYRAVVEDTQGRLWVMEEIHRRDLLRKQRIAACLDFLSGQGLSRLPSYQKSCAGENIVTMEKGCWQLQPFIPGVVLDRTRYLQDQWRGPVLAEFLLELRQTTSGRNLPVSPEIFSITKYISTLVEQVQRRRPDVRTRLAPVLDFLAQEFWAAHDRLPVCFCHGDYHPLNIIWESHGIRAVIDWEFCGVKPEIYDISNMVGCLGMEHPSALTGDLVLSFLERLRAGQVIAATSWRYLLEFVVALRFAWLSEWLRKHDEEMVDLELVYMNLLLERHALLREAWGIRLPEFSKETLRRALRV